MHPATRPTAAPVSLLVLLAACGMGANDASGGAAAGLDAPARAGVVAFEIGVADGEAAYVFGLISGVALDSEGRIYVADWQADEVRVFSPDGRFLYAIGRTGSGPGELRGPCCLAFDDAGRLWVRDGGNARYDTYQVGSDGARYVGQIRMAHSDVNYGAPTTFDRAGHLIDVGHRMDRAAGQLKLYRLHLDSAGSVVREEAIETPSPEELGAHIVDRASDGGVSRFFVWPPYGPMHLVAHSPDGSWATALSTRYEVQWHGPAGGPARVIRREDVAGPRISAAERSAAEERLAEQLNALGVAPGAVDFGVPERKPPLRGLFFDRLGRLWVQRSVAEGEANEADVYATDGTLAAHVRWPAGVRLTAGFVLEDRAFGLTSDELGAPKVVRLDFVPERQPRPE